MRKLSYKQEEVAKYFMMMENKIREKIIKMRVQDIAQGMSFIEKVKLVFKI